jgi:hypothetical protein
LSICGTEAVERRAETDRRHLVEFSASGLLT